MYEYEFNEHVMGTNLSVSLITDDESTATNIFTLTLVRLRGYEAKFSRFLPESELSKLNRERSGIVSPLFISLLHIAQELYQKTDGYFNPLLQINRFGYTESFEFIKDAASPLQTLPYNTNLNMVIIDDEAQRVTLVDDQQLDFGGFLKGYLAEYEARKIMHEHSDVHGVIINIGGDIHTRGKDADGKVFVFEIKNPLTGQGIPLPLENMSLATSGTYRHAWNRSGEPVHHILARDGLHNPPTSVISASVVHENGATAEAYAKTLMSIHPTTLQTITDETFPYIIIHKDGTIHTSL